MPCVECVASVDRVLSVVCVPVWPGEPQEVS